MAEITTQQLAQMLLGIARAQNAIVDALENSKAGFKSNHFRSAVETAARIRSNRPETLADYPSRLLLQMMGRTAPDADSVARDLENLLAPKPTPGVSEPPPAAAAAPADDSSSLDMTR
jgi:hypothetical protein